MLLIYGIIGIDDATRSKEEIMGTEKYLIISDVHGCFEELKQKLTDCKYNPEKDFLIFLGDYIDRGPNSKEVIDFILQLKEKSNDIVCLMGNHETMFLDYLNEKNRELFLINGGDKTIKSYGEVINIPKNHIKFFKSLQYYYETNNYIFVHAGLVPGISLQDQKRKDLVWIRDEFLYSNFDFGKNIVFGHTPQSELPKNPKKAGIDMGCFFTGYLLAYEINGSKI